MQLHIKKWDLSQECKIGPMLENHCNTFYSKNKTTRLYQEAFDKIQHSFMIKKNTNKLDIEKPTADFLLNGERLETFPTKPWKRKDVCSHHFCLIL